MDGQVWKVPLGCLQIEYQGIIHLYAKTWTNKLELDYSKEHSVQELVLIDKSTSLIQFVYDDSDESYASYSIKSVAPDRMTMSSSTSPLQLVLQFGS